MIFGLAASPCFAGQSDNCLPYKTTDGATPVIQAMVQAQGPFSFVLDTASSGTTLDEKTAARLRLSRDAATETAEGLGGPTDVRLYRVTTLTAGPLALTNFTAPGIPAPLLEGQEVVGLAGVDLFGGVLATWNARPGCVVIGDSGAPPEGEGWQSVAAHWIRPWKIMLPVRIGSVDGWGLLDTGAQYTVLNPAFADALGLTAASGRYVDGGAITGIDGQPLALSQTEVKDVVVGAWRWDRRLLRVGDLPVFARLGEPSAPLAVIGVDWLADRSFGIDYGRETVWQRPATGGAIDRQRAR